MDCDSERICLALFKKEEWKQNEELGKYEGLVAKQKLKTEADITTGRIRVRSCDHICRNVHSVLCPPEDNIAALDFGTTYCSLAMTTVEDDKASCLKLDNYHPRVPNAILLRKLDSSSATAVPCEIRAFGNEAQAAFARLRPNEINRHLFFERIKMNLQHNPVSAQFTFSAVCVCVCVRAHVHARKRVHELK